MSRRKRDRRARALASVPLASRIRCSTVVVDTWLEETASLHEALCVLLERMPDHSSARAVLGAAARTLSQARAPIAEMVAACVAAERGAQS